ncbi:PPC domain-containing DNA-binding protein [Denitrobaculum tricleocarpae]|uniref:PPC domain-containing DNA-binding protein n=1 Tax=Denitrobaculum tricleocarpae TaxID=2591009 RepID=UPI001FED0448|nr:PPC domain-containing DNA-binding protein [Denitrobaculum tricleocarpae]
MSTTRIERGSFGRSAVIRLRPNEDLIEGVEQACLESGISHAVVRSAVGSLVDAVLAYGVGPKASQGDENTIVEKGPGVEILTLTGELAPGEDGRPKADLRGTISTPDARVLGGRFLPGRNSICITLELVIQEWLPETATLQP